MARRTLTALAFVTGLTCCPRDARANHGNDGIIEGVLVFFLLGDAVFVTWDTVVVARNEHPNQTACIVEAIVGAPQFLLYGSLTSELGEAKDTGFVAAIGTIPTFMTIHGIWGASTKKTDPGALYGVSWATGADLAFTVPAVRQAARGSLPDRGTGFLEVLATTPQLAVATRAAIQETGPERSAWYALDGWAGLLFVHGAVSALAPQHEPQPVPSPPPPVPEPAPEPTPSGPLEIEAPERAPPPKPTSAFLVPGTLRLRPMPVPGGAGLSISAILW